MWRGLAILVVIAGIAVGLYFLIAKLTDQPAAASSATTGKVTLESTTLQTNAQRILHNNEALTTVNVNTDCAVPTVANDMCDTTPQGELSAYRVCTVTGFVNFEPRYGDDQYYDFITDCDGTDSHKVVFGPTGTNSLVLPLDNVLGVVTNMCIYPSAPDSDPYKYGFKPDENHSPTTAIFDAMVTDLQANATFLVGKLETYTDNPTPTEYTFNATSPVAIPITKPPADTSLPLVEGKAVGGVVRMSPKYVDYEFKLNTTNCRLRLWISHPDVPMATKSPGVFNTTTQAWEYYVVEFADGDTLADAVVKGPYGENETPPAPASGKEYVSFWNQQKLDTEQQQGGPDQSAVQAAYTAAYSGYNIPMPLQQMEPTLDLSIFSGDVTINLVTAANISFRDVKDTEMYAEFDGFTDAQLADAIIADKKLFATLYEMRDISFRMLAKAAA